MIYILKETSHFKGSLFIVSKSKHVSIMMIIGTRIVYVLKILITPNF